MCVPAFVQFFVMMFNDVCLMYCLTYPVLEKNPDAVFKWFLGARSSQVCLHIMFVNFNNSLANYADRTAQGFQFDSL